MPNNLNQTDKKHAIIIILAFAAIYIIWGTTYFAIRVAVQTIPPFFMAGARFLFSGMLIFIILRLRGVPMPKRFHWRSAVIVGALLLVGGNGLVTWSEQQVPSSTAALLVATVPLWIALFDWLILSEAITVATIAAAIIIILAVILITTGGRDRALVQRTTPGQARNPALPSRFVAEAPKSGQRGPLASPPSTLIASPAQIIPPGE